MTHKKKSFLDYVWDCWCCISVVGIWPRFIEPNLLFKKKLSLPIKNLPECLANFKIIQFSDLHLNSGIPNLFLKKIIESIKKEKPDLIVFTGDFLCYSQTEDPERLQSFLKQIPLAKYGNYAVFGNHDYRSYAFINEEGDYDIAKQKEEKSNILKGLQRIFKKLNPTGKFTKNAFTNSFNEGLEQILKKTSFQVLHNKTIKIPVNNAYINICGLGEYMAGMMEPETAFANYDTSFPGIILLHNPDGIPFLKNYPGDLILSGHTHGGQINLPFFSKKFTIMENIEYKKGLFKVDSKWAYVTRGIAAVMNFRWFSPPEIVTIELTDDS